MVFLSLIWTNRSVTKLQAQLVRARLGSASGSLPPFNPRIPKILSRPKFGTRPGPKWVVPWSGSGVAQPMSTPRDKGMHDADSLTGDWSKWVNGILFLCQRPKCAQLGVQITIAMACHYNDLGYWTCKWENPSKWTQNHISKGSCSLIQKPLERFIWFTRKRNLRLPKKKHRKQTLGLPCAQVICNRNMHSLSCDSTHVNDSILQTFRMFFPSLFFMHWCRNLFLICQCGWDLKCVMIYNYATSQTLFYNFFL